MQKASSHERTLPGVGTRLREDAAGGGCQRVPAPTPASSLEGRDIPTKLPPYTASAAPGSCRKRAPAKPTTALARTGSASSPTSLSTMVATAPTACQKAKGRIVDSQWRADSWSVRPRPELPPNGARRSSPVLTPVLYATADVARKAVAPSRPPMPTNAFPAWMRISYKRAVVAPRTSARCLVGMIAREHMPAKDPQNAACPSRLSKTMLQRSVRAAEAITLEYRACANHVR
mmetsp:Transcript_20953/g.45613  ORF Transcript_20953/g.45613 Transcript_20953/m.45613 type:complete len:232 (+) Transcript_20953:73-768(+)